MPSGKPSKGQRDHTYVDATGTRRDRASFAGEPEAHRAANRVFDLTGRRYSAYRCRWVARCSAWHIRMLPRSREREQMARPA